MILRQHVRTTVGSAQSSATAHRQAGNQNLMHPMLNTAIRRRAEAGSVIQRGARDLDWLTITSRPKDFVSEVSKAAEAAIVETLLEAYPDHGILAEEGTVNAKVKNPDNVWIIDRRRHDQLSARPAAVLRIDCAAQHKGVITQGVVYDPNRNDLFTTTRSAGAYLNDRRLRVSRRVRMDDSLVATGFPFKDGSTVETYMGMMRR
jgi:myo-inositol-1(or 4)-monophosphatase